MKERDPVLPTVYVVEAQGREIDRAILSRGITIRIPKFNDQHLYKYGLVVMVEENNVAAAGGWFDGWLAGRDFNYFVPGSQLTKFESGHNVTVYGSLFGEGDYGIGATPTKYTIVN